MRTSAPSTAPRVAALQQVRPPVKGLSGTGQLAEGCSCAVRCPCQKSSVSCTPVHIEIPRPRAIRSFGQVAGAKKTSSIGQVDRDPITCQA